MENDLATIGLILAAAAILTAFVLWIRRPEPVPLDGDEPAAFDRLPVEHEGTTP